MSFFTLQKIPDPLTERARHTSAEAEAYAYGIRLARHNRAKASTLADIVVKAVQDELRRPQ